MNRYWIPLLACCPSVLAQNATFQGIGHLPGQQTSAALGVSADGRVVVGKADAGSNTAAIRWMRTTGLEILEPAPGFGAPSWNWSALAASAHGSVIVGSADADRGGWMGADSAFRWTAATGMVDLGHLPGATHSGAMDVSGDGSIIVGLSGPGAGFESTAFRWTEAGGMEEFLSLSPSMAVGISSDGSAIVGHRLVFGFHWTQSAGMQGVGHEVENFPAAVSADGTFVVGQQGSVGFPYRWSIAAGLQSLGMLPEHWMAGASAVSADGSIVVGYSYDDFGRHAFIWDEVRGIVLLHDMLESIYGLNLQGWQLLQATGISADGSVIVGIGRNPAGHEEGWVALFGPAACYANCDGSTTEPILTVDDFTCFIDAFAAAQLLPHQQQIGHYANCDGSTQAPVLTVDDFTCFINAFAAGCP